MKTEVNYDHLIRLLEERRNYNKIPLEDIEWVRDDGSKIEVDPKIIEDWKFIGLSNSEFAELCLSRIVAGEQEELLKELTWKEVQ